MVSQAVLFFILLYLTIFSLEFQLKQLYVIHNVETLLLKAVPNPSVSIIDGEYNGQFAKEAVNSTYGKKLAKQWLSGWSLYQRKIIKKIIICNYIEILI